MVTQETVEFQEPQVQMVQTVIMEIMVPLQIQVLLVQQVQQVQVVYQVKAVFQQLQVQLVQAVL